MPLLSQGRVDQLTLQMLTYYSLIMTINVQHGTYFLPSSNESVIAKIPTNLLMPLKLFLSILIHVLKRNTP